MTVKITTLTAVLALSVALGSGAALAQTPTITVPLDGSSGTQASPALSATDQAATPAASGSTTTAGAGVVPQGPDGQPVTEPSTGQVVSGQGSGNVAPNANTTAPATTGGTPRVVQPTPATGGDDRPSAAGIAPAPAPEGGPAAEAAATEGTTTVPVPQASPGNNEPPVTTQDSPDAPRGDQQPEVSGTGDPSASTLANEPAPGQLGAETPQAAAPVVIPQGSASTSASPGSGGAATTPAADPAAPTTAVTVPGSDTPAATKPAGTPPNPAPDAGSDTGGGAASTPATPAEGAAAAPSEAAGAAAEGQDPTQTTPPAAPGPDADQAASAEAGPAAGEAAAPEGAADHTEGAAHHQAITDIAFPFEGPFGRFDQFQLQRGLQVYTEVCSACHGMRYVAIRTLGDQGGPGLPEDQVRAYAATMDIDDPETGETRPRVPTDHFPHNTSAGAPDLSVMAKARASFHGPTGTGISQFVNGIGGPEYIFSVLTHYTGKTKEEAGETFYENTAFPSGWIKMPPPIADDQVTYADGHSATLGNEAQDVAAFLMWAAEPKMMGRKKAGMMAVLFLAGLTVMLYFTNKRLWWSVKHPTNPRTPAPGPVSVGTTRPVTASATGTGAGTGTGRRA